MEPADVKSPQTSALGWAAGAGAPKSRRGAGSAECERDGRKGWSLVLSLDKRWEKIFNSQVKM